MGHSTPRWFLLLAGLVFAIVAAPAWANFEAVVAAYERGADHESYDEYGALERGGDVPAQSHLDRVHRKLYADSASGSSNQPGSSEPRESGAQPESDRTLDITLWNSLDGQPASSATDEILVPYRVSVWSTLFHLPADATVIGMQYVSKLLDADRLGRYLEEINRKGGKFGLATLAVLWWLLIFRSIYGLGRTLARIVRSVSTSWEYKTHG